MSIATLARISLAVGVDVVHLLRAEHPDSLSSTKPALHSGVIELATGRTGSRAPGPELAHALLTIAAAAGTMALEHLMRWHRLALEGRVKKVAMDAQAAADELYEALAQSRERGEHDHSTMSYLAISSPAQVRARAELYRQVEELATRLAQKEAA